MTSSPGPRLTIQHARRRDAGLVSAFYLAHPSDFLWPRDREFIEARAKDEGLFLAIDGDRMIAGACYVIGEEADPGAVERWELGGILVRDDCCGRGVADAMCSVALAAHLTTTPPTDRVEL